MTSAISYPSWYEEFLQSYGQGGSRFSPSGIGPSGSSAPQPQYHHLSEWYAMGLSPEELMLTPGSYTGVTPGNLEFLSELGYAPTLPGKNIAPLVQYLADRKAAERNLGLAEQATGLYGQAGQRFRDMGTLFRDAQSTFSAYRPGGAAELTSGIYSGQAQALAGEAQALGGQARSLYGQMTEAPDLMFEFERNLAERGQRQAMRMARNQFYAGIGMGVFQGGVQMGSAALGASGGGGGGGGGGNFFEKVFGFAEGGVVPPSQRGTRMQINGQPSVVGEPGKSKPAEHEVVAPLSQVKEVARQVAAGEREAGAQVKPPQPEDVGAQSGMGGGDPGRAGYTLEGAAQLVSQRVGVPADMLHAIIRDFDEELEPGLPSLGDSLNQRLDQLLRRDLRARRRLVA